MADYNFSGYTTVPAEHEYSLYFSAQGYYETEIVDLILDFLVNNAATIYADKAEVVHEDISPEV